MVAAGEGVGVWAKIRGGRKSAASITQGVVFLIIKVLCYGGSFYNRGGSRRSLVGNNRFLLFIFYFLFANGLLRNDSDFCKFSSDTKKPFVAYFKYFYFHLFDPQPRFGAGCIHGLFGRFHCFRQPVRQCGHRRFHFHEERHRRPDRRFR